MRCGRAGRLPKCLYIRCTSAVASLSRGSFVFSLVFTVALIPGAMERPLPHASTYDELASSAAEFRGSGVAFVPSLVDAPTLGSLRHALEDLLSPSARVTADCAASVGWRSVGYVDAPELLESTGRECLGLLEDPRLVGLLQAAVGNDAHLINLQASIGPPSDELHVGTRLQREYWREDGSGALQRGSFVHPVLSEGVKVIIALSDQDSCATYVPHTNRCPEEPHSNGPSRVWKAKRGDAMLMDVRTWHSAFSPAMEQGSLILYAGAFNKKPMAGVAKVVAQLNSSGALSPLARQILGVYEGAPGNHMHRGGEQIQFAPPVPSPQNRSTADIIESIPRLDFDAGHNDAPQSLDDQVQHMRDWGYVRLKSFVAPTTLAELQSEFHKEQDAVLNDIVRAQDNSTALAKLPVLTTDAVLPKMFDLPFGEGQVLEGDMGAPLLKIIESAGPLVARVVGRDAQVINIQPRTVPANEDLMQKVKAGGEPSTTGYTGWHRDEGSANGVFVHPLITTNVKLIVAVSSQQGGLEGSTVLPGTHRVHESPASQSGHEGKFLVSEIEESHERVFVGDAGDAVLFDTKTWHKVLPNLSGALREYFIIRFSPFSMRQAGALTSAIGRLRASGHLDQVSPELLQLLGLQPIAGGENVYEGSELQANL